MMEWLTDLQRRMEKTLHVLEEDLLSLRAGRASVQLLDKISVQAYGVATPLKQLANISTPEARLLVVQVWDKSLSSEVEKALRASDLALNPLSDGQLIRIVLPALSEERRKDLLKTVRQKAEQAKVALRNVRRDVNESFKKEPLTLSEDDIKKAQGEVQKQTDLFIQRVDTMVLRKEKEILED